MIVKHNLTAMNTNRQLGIVTDATASSTEKLSSGYKINRAADDAAGLAISEKMRKQIRGLDRASANAEDGISCVQTAEGAIAEVQDMLQRMNELCVQAANGTNSENDRSYIQDEIDQLVSEIDRIAETTKFNDMYLLKGTDTAPTKSVYITDYSTTYTKNIVNNADAASALTHKVNYTGTNNVYMVEKAILDASPSLSLTAKAIQEGDDITDYMVDWGSSTNKTGATLNTNKYVAFVNVELNSDVATGNNGSVNGATTYDLSTNGVDTVVRANQTLYIYNTDNSTATRITAGTDMTKYLNDDNTMKDQYRLVDILDGGAANTALYRGPEDLYLLNAAGTAYEESTQAYNSDVSTLTGDWGYAVDGKELKVTSVLDPDPDNDATTDDAKYTISYDAAYIEVGGTLYSLPAETGLDVDVADIDTETIALDGVPASATAGTITVKELLENTYKTYVSASDFVSKGTSTRVKNSVLAGSDFVWSDREIAYDMSKQKLYDANGIEVTGIGLNKFYDENGNYMGGLYTTSQARAVDEVFGNADSDAYKNIQSLTGGATTIDLYITQSSTQVAASLSFELQAGADSAIENRLGIDIDTLTSAGLGIDKLASKNIGIVDSTGLLASSAIDVVGDALDQISRQRAKLGAIQNRLDHTIKNLDNVVENTQSAESAIRDTDMAEEMVQYSNQNILQQAGQSMLAQANQANQGVLNLLQ